MPLGAQRVLATWFRERGYRCESTRSGLGTLWLKEHPAFVALANLYTPARQGQVPRSIFQAVVAKKNSPSSNEVTNCKILKAQTVYSVLHVIFRPSQRHIVIVARWACKCREVWVVITLKTANVLMCASVRDLECPVHEANGE